MGNFLGFFLPDNLCVLHNAQRSAGMAAHLAAQILATAEPELSAKLKEKRQANAQAVIEKDAKLQQRL